MYQQWLEPIARFWAGNSLQIQFFKVSVLVYLLPLPVNPLAVAVQCTQLKTDFKRSMSPQEQNLMHAKHYKERTYCKPLWTQRLKTKVASICRRPKTLIHQTAHATRKKDQTSSVLPSVSGGDWKCPDLSAPVITTELRTVSFWFRIFLIRSTVTETSGPGEGNNSMFWFWFLTLPDKRRQKTLSKTLNIQRTV